MDDMTIDIDKRGAIIALLHEVGIPKFVVKRFRGHGESPMSACTVFYLDYQALPDSHSMATIVSP
ncbi:MAG TPA: hypothetical protein VF433_00610, partial [Cellvibrio sp.]